MASPLRVLGLRGRIFILDRMLSVKDKDSTPFSI